MEHSSYLDRPLRSYAEAVADKWIATPRKGIGHVVEATEDHNRAAVALALIADTKKRLIALAGTMTAEARQKLGDKTHDYRWWIDAELDGLESLFHGVVNRSEEIDPSLYLDMSVQP